MKKLQIPSSKLQSQSCGFLGFENWNFPGAWNSSGFTFGHGSFALRGGMKTQIQDPNLSSEIVLVICCCMPQTDVAVVQHKSNQPMTPSAPQSQHGKDTATAPPS